MNVGIIFSFILVKSQPLLSILGLTQAVVSVQLAAIFAVALISTAIVIGIVSLMMYGWKKLTQKEVELDSDSESDEHFDSDFELNEDFNLPPKLNKDFDSDPELNEDFDLLPPKLNEDFDSEQTPDLEAPRSLKVSTRIQAAPGASGYKPEPKIIGEYYDTLETITAIHAYRDLCLHIEKTILKPNDYSIKYKIENNHLTAYLHSPDSIIKINVDNVFLELNGRFDVVLKLLKTWNADCQNIGVLQKHLSMLPDSIDSSDADDWIDNNLGFCQYTAHFWGKDKPCRLLNSFIWSNPSKAHPYCNTSPHNISLLIIMPIALTKYLSMMKEGPYRSAKTLQRTEGDFCSYTPGDVIDCKIFRPFSQIHPADTPIKHRFYTNPNFLVLNNYIGGQLADSPFPNEKEVVITTDILITVTEITQNCTKRRKTPYKKIKMSAAAKPAIADKYLANPPEAILSNLFDKSVAKHFTNTNVLSTILEYTGLPSDVSNNKLGNKAKKTVNNL